MGPSRTYLRRYWLVLTLSACTYVATAGTTLLRARTGANTEFFPIFAWDLFSVVPNDTRDYGLMVLSLDGEALDPPAFVETLQGRGTGFSMSAHMAIQELGEAAKKGDVARQRALIALLRGTYLGGLQRPVRFELMRRHYNVLARYRDGAFTELTPVALGVKP